MSTTGTVSKFIGAIVLFAASASEPGRSSEPLNPYEIAKACPSISDAAKRLSCFDNAFAELEAAVARKDVYITDRTQVRKTKRTLFGLPLPNLGIFGTDDDGAESEDLSHIESTVSTARQDADGWVVTIEEGSTWRQIDGAPLALAPRKGMPVVVRRGALHSYKMSIRNQPPIKVRRII